MHSSHPDSCASAADALVLDLADEAATMAFGRALSRVLGAGMVVWLDGDLGAGKTTLVRALLRALGHEGPVKSPTYTLVEVYVLSSIYWYHFDFYRFNNPEEFEEAGLDEYFRSDSVCLVEWPEKAAGYLPPADLSLHLAFVGAGRQLEVRAFGARGRECLSCLRDLTRAPGAGN